MSYANTTPVFISTTYEELHTSLLTYPLDDDYICGREVVYLAEDVAVGDRCYLSGNYYLDMNNNLVGPYPLAMDALDAFLDHVEDIRYIETNGGLDDLPY